MAGKTKNRIKKMNFQLQKRTHQQNPLSEEDKYLIQMASYKQRDTGRSHENISRLTRGGVRPQYI
jgi:hypothetical protein